MHSLLHGCTHCYTDGDADCCADCCTDCCTKRYTLHRLTRRAPSIACGTAHARRRASVRGTAFHAARFWPSWRARSHSRSRLIRRVTVDVTVVVAVVVAVGRCNGWCNGRCRGRCNDRCNIRPPLRDRAGQVLRVLQRQLGRQEPQLHQLGRVQRQDRPDRRTRWPLHRVMLH